MSAAMSVQSRASLAAVLSLGLATGETLSDDEVVERLTVRAGGPLLRAPLLDVQLAQRIAEREDHLDLAADDGRGEIGVARAVRARDDARVPGREHHVLRAATDVEHPRLAGDGDDESGGTDVLRRPDRVRERV